MDVSPPPPLSVKFVLSAALVAVGIRMAAREPVSVALATLLVVGRMEPVTFVMKKCSALALEGIGVHWAVRWHISPELLG